MFVYVHMLMWFELM